MPRLRATPFVRLSLATLAFTLAAAPALGESSFVFSFRGRGHGVGLSQWGAKAMAHRGWSYKRILSYYFRKTTVGGIGNPVVRVALEANDGALEAWTVRARSGSLVFTCGSSKRTFPAGRWYTVRRSSSGRVVVRDDAGAQMASFRTVTRAANGVAGRCVQVMEPVGQFAYTKSLFRGSFRFVTATGGIKLYNDVRMDDYLRGVVPREIGRRWPTNAVRSQVVCSRSYAYSLRNPKAAFDVWSTTRAQVYQGYGRDSSSGLILYEEADIDAAVKYTSGQVVKYGSTVVRAFFDSSNGGHSENIEAVWGAEPKPYCVGVPDPYEPRMKQPTHFWRTDWTFPASQLKAKLDAEGVRAPAQIVDVKVTERNRYAAIPTGTRVRTLVLKGAARDDVTLRGRDVDRFVAALGIKTEDFWSLPMCGRWFFVSRTPDTRIRRMAGADRYETSVWLARAGGSSTWAVVSNGKAPVDAFTGAGLAGARGAPVLLTTRQGVPWWVGDWMRYYYSGIRRVAVIGGPDVVGSGAWDQLEAAVGKGNVVRIGGTNRYVTAANVAKTMKTYLGSSHRQGAVVVEGSSVKDAAIASGMSASCGYPLLYVRPDSVPGVTMNALKAYPRTRRVYVIGGSVRSGARKALRAAGFEVVHLAGADAVSTSLLVADRMRAEGCDASRVGVFSSEGLIDALALAPYVARANGITMMTPADSLDPRIGERLVAWSAAGTDVKVVMPGGESVLKPRVLDDAALALP